ncbi:MAG: hypothetical protein IIC93_07460 [Chloroflexi bacterium]|nr:hypothetical protein [Chloroflexota bacterium]
MSHTKFIPHIVGDEQIRRLEMNTQQTMITTSNDHAGVMFLPPPAFVPPLVAGLLLHFLWTQLRFFPEWWIGHAVGWPLVVAGVLLMEWSKRTMRRAGVDPHPYEPTTAIVAD